MVTVAAACPPSSIDVSASIEFEHVHDHEHAGAANGPANGSDYDAGRVEYDAASGLINYEEYHPFGTSAYRAVDSTIEVSAKRYRYAAAERDEETGLDHMGLRYYAPWLGRWTSADPIGLGDGVNRYGYVHGNPVSMRDPGGTKTEKVDPTQPPVRQAGESESAYLQRFKEFQQSAEVQEALKQDAAAQPKAKAKAEPEPSDIGRGGEGEGAGGVTAPAEDPGDVPGTPEGGEGDDAGSWLADAFTGFLAAVGVTSGDKVNFEADSTNLGVPGGSGTGEGARWKQLVYLVREALTAALTAGVSARAPGALGWVAEKLGRAADRAKQAFSRLMRKSDDTARKTSTGGGAGARGAGLVADLPTPPGGVKALERLTGWSKGGRGLAGQAENLAQTEKLIAELPSRIGEIRAGGVTREMAQAWADAYAKIATQNPATATGGNPNALARSRLMQAIANLL